MIGKNRVKRWFSIVIIYLWLRYFLLILDQSAEFEIAHSLLFKNKKANKFLKSYLKDKSQIRNTERCVLLMLGILTFSLYLSDPMIDRKKHKFDWKAKF